MNGRPDLGTVVAVSIIVLLAGQVAVAQVEWTYQDLAVGPGPPGSWNSSRHQVGDVIFDGTTYHMYLVGGQTPLSWDSPWAVGHWTSTDPAGPWTPDVCNPVLEPTPGAWDGYTIYKATVLFDGSMFRMWYGATDVQYDRVNVGYATNTDGWCDWDKVAGPLVGLEPGAAGEWDDWGITPGTVVADGATYHMWYHAFAYSTGMLDFWRIGHAASTDGLIWIKDHDPVLEATEPWEEDKVYFPEVAQIGGSLGMWYSSLREDPSPDVARIGYAVSPDGLAWGKWPGNPVLSPLAPTPGCDAVDSFAVIRDGDTLHGWTTSCFDVYHVTAPFEVLLFDGFESGSTDLWSLVLP